MIIFGKLAASNFFYATAVSVDTERRLYRQHFRYLSLFRKSGAWRPLPDVKYVLLFRTLYAKCESCSIEDFNRSSLIQLSLVHGKNRKLIVNESSDAELIYAQAEQLAADLSVRLRDAASDRRNPRWLPVAA